MKQTLKRKLLEKQTNFIDIIGFPAHCRNKNDLSSPFVNSTAMLWRIK